MTSKRCLPGTALAALTLAPSLIAQAPPEAARPAAPAPQALASQVDAYLEPLVKHDLISGSVVIARDGQVVLSRDLGPANREHGIPVSAGTRFRIGSLSKQFTAAGILLLEQRGKLKLEDPLSKYLPDFPNSGNITLHQLLTHTSGLANCNRMPDYFLKSMQPLSTAEVIAWFKAQPVKGQPGERWEYSNSNYMLLAAVIEKVSGMGFAAFMQTQLFDPLGMKDTCVDRFEDVLPGRAEGYLRDEQGVHRAGYRDMPFMNGAGSIVSSTRDLLRWDQALRTDLPLGRTARERLFKPLMRDYACGWFVEQRFGRKLVSHSGDISGFRCDLQRFVDDGLTVIMLLNMESTFTPAVARDLGAMALGLPARPALVLEGVPLEPAKLAEAAGSYPFAPGNALTLTLEKDRLVAQAPGMPSATAIPQGGDLFFVLEWNGMIRLVRSPEGQIQGLRLVQGAHTVPAQRAK